MSRPTSILRTLVMENQDHGYVLQHVKLIRMVMQATVTTFNHMLGAVIERKTVLAKKVTMRKKNSARRAHHRDKPLLLAVVQMNSRTDIRRVLIRRDLLPRPHDPMDKTVSDGKRQQQTQTDITMLLAIVKRKTVNIRKKIPVTPGHHSLASLGG